MFRLALGCGADLHVMNRQNLTPLTLAAFLAKKEMMEKIIEEESVVDWTYGKVQSAAYPLEHLDSIEPTSGKAIDGLTEQSSHSQINPQSALALVVYGEKVDHLQLLPNLLDQLVQQKWQTYGKRT